MPKLQIEQHSETTSISSNHEFSFFKHPPYERYFSNDTAITLIDIAGTQHLFA